MGATMTNPESAGRVKLGGYSRAFDQMIAAASAVATSIITGPIGAARIPETSNAPAAPLTADEAYRIGYRVIADARNRRPE